jgi:pimeloyl-ACP methyl ester carboxylesterase
MLDRWSAAAGDQGYILVAPEWQNGIGGEYGYAPEEHRTVTETLRDLRRCFQVDSDRVFLFGLGEGGKMAFDVGLAHPQLFAGVLPMCAGPNYYPFRYWRNAQYLPFYCVSGTRAADSNTLLTEQFKNWTIRGYPTLWIDYKGRGVDWLSGEVPNMFDWMRHQRRVFPLRQLGSDGGGGSFGNEFCTMRPEDDRFYWLGTSDISPRNIVQPGNWKNLTPPATLTGRIDSQANEIYLRTSGLNQVSIWLGRNPKGQYMIDFDKPVTVHVGLGVAMNKQRIQPSLAVLLEDLYQRGDRKHLFVARIDVDLRRNRAVVADAMKLR